MLQIGKSQLDPAFPIFSGYKMIIAKDPFRPGTWARLPAGTSYPARMGQALGLNPTEPGRPGTWAGGFFSEKLLITLIKVRHQSSLLLLPPRPIRLPLLPPGSLASSSSATCWAGQGCQPGHRLRTLARPGLGPPSQSGPQT